jgi:adenosylmethionine-8-amino-7-oxononanoate aminotransferase
MRSRGVAGPGKRPAPHRSAQDAGNQADGHRGRQRLDHLRRRCTNYLDAKAGLWCVNIGYGRGEFAEVAAEQMRQLSYFPHTAMNLSAAALAEKINGLMSDGYTILGNSGSARG